MPSGGFNVPVIFLVFNRPRETSRVFAGIRRARPARLVVVADGPRVGHATDAADCAAVRALIDAGVDWPCDVTRDYAATNLGCARRVSSGISRAFTELEEAIILEDDCLPDPTFFPFCAELLATYRNEPRVAQIAGCCFASPAPEDRSYFFSRYAHCWGWATWRRAWRTYDHEMTAWKDSSSRSTILQSFEDSAERDYWRHAFDSASTGRIDSWAYRWALSCWAENALSANATTNLVTNIGYDAAATHTHGRSPMAAIPARPATFPLRHPDLVVRDAGKDADVGSRCFHRPSWFQRVASRIRRMKL